VKRGAELKRKTPLRSTSKTYHDYMVEKGFVSSTTLQPLPKLPPLPDSLAKAAKKASRRPNTTNARQAAKGQECQIRVPGYCERTTDTVVLCHYRLAGLSGAGLKPPDWLGAYGCATCHAIVDGRHKIKPPYDRDTLRLWHAEAVFRTQAIIRAESAL